MKINQQTVSWLQVAPLTVVLLVFFGIPMLIVAAVSFFDYERWQIVPAFIFDNYVELFQSSLTLRLYVTAIKYVVIVWAVTLIIGFTVAYFLVFHVRSLTLKMGLFLLCTVPFWTSNIIRMISWIPFLGRNGVFNTGLEELGIIDQPLSFLLFSDFAVIVAYVHLNTLFMIVPIFNSMARIDPGLIEAAHDAGASRWRVIWEVVLPLSKTGNRVGLDLRHYVGDGRLLRRQDHERRAERDGGLRAGDRDREPAISACRGERRRAGRDRGPDGVGDLAPGRRAPGIDRLKMG